MNIEQKNIWGKALLSGDGTIQDAIHTLNDAALQIVMVVTSDGVLEGTITDGDIRRGLLRGLSLESPVSCIVYRDSFVVTPEISSDTVLHLMQANKLLQLPVIDDNRCVVGLHVWDEVNQQRKQPNMLIIMAGGRGTRLHPHTESCPKPLLLVGAKPILEHIIERAKSEGFRHFVIAIHYLGHMIKEYFGDGSRWNVKVEYLNEESPLGTAGALSLLDPQPDLPFVVTNGDVLTDIRYGELLDFHNSHEAVATMAIRLHEWQHPFGVVKINGVDITGFDEKPVSRSYINAGVYVLEPSALKELGRGEHCDMPTLFSHLKNNTERTIAYPMHEPWLDVGRPDDLSRAINEDGKKTYKLKSTTE